MPFSTGTKLGTYEILSAIGAGGMGEVYQAHDTKLGRDVAIKKELLFIWLGHGFQIILSHALTRTQIRRVQQTTLSLIIYSFIPIRFPKLDLLRRNQTARATGRRSDLRGTKAQRQRTMVRGASYPTASGCERNRKLALLNRGDSFTGS